MSFGRAASDQRGEPPGGTSTPGGRAGRRPLFPAPRPHPGTARFVLGFVAGCATVLPWAAYLSFRDAHPPASAGAYYGLDIAAKVGACALATLPASWIVLALMQLRYAFTVACAGWALSMMFSVLLSMLVRGGALPAWVYGLCSGLCYGTAALLSISSAASSRAQSATAASIGSWRTPQAAVHAGHVHIRVQNADTTGPESTAPAHEAGEAGS